MFLCWNVSLESLELELAGGSAHAQRAFSFDTIMLTSSSAVV